LDVNDLKILELLDKNSRFPYDAIGQIVGLTGNAVRSRVIQMINDQVIENFVFKIHPKVFGVKTAYLKYTMNDKINTAEIVNEKIGKDPRYVEIITGINGEAVIRIYGRGDEDLKEAIGKLRNKMKQFQFDYLVKRYIPPLEEVKINNSLLKVMDCLIDDVRMSVADLAKKCNMTSKSVKYYLEQIKIQKIGRFSINFQPYKVTKRIFVNILISKPNLDYIQFANIFESLKQDLNSYILKDYLLVDPPGVFCDITAESLEQIDTIEHKIIEYLKDDYEFKKMFPSKKVYRTNLINRIVKEKIERLNVLSD